MYDRFIKSWLTSVFGLTVAIFGGIMFYQSKIDSTAFLAILGTGAAIAGIKYK